MKYRSKFESKFNLLTDGKLEYEPVKVKYTIPESVHVYTPDWRIPGTNIFGETKGLWPAKERQKMLLVLKQHPEMRIIMVFYRANCPINKGSKTTYEMFCQKNGIEFMSIPEFQKLVKKFT